MFLFHWLMNTFTLNNSRMKIIGLQNAPHVYEARVSIFPNAKNSRGTKALSRVPDFGVRKPHSKMGREREKFYLEGADDYNRPLLTSSPPRRKEILLRKQADNLSSITFLLS